MPTSELDRPYVECEWLHAPKFRAWLESLGVEVGHLSASHQRQWAGWGLDQMSITVQLADEVCIDRGYHLSMIPDHCWDTDKTGKYGKRHSANDRKKARDMRYKGYTVRQIASSMGIATRTAHKWVRDIDASPSVLIPEKVAEWIIDNIPQDSRLGDRRLDSAIIRWAAARNVPKPQNLASLIKPYGKTMDDIPATCWERGSNGKAKR